MSKGSDRVTLRFSADTLEAIDRKIEQYNRKQTCREPLDRSEWIRLAVKERLHKLGRSNPGTGPCECTICGAKFHGNVKKKCPTCGNYCTTRISKKGVKS